MDLHIPVLLLLCFSGAPTINGEAGGDNSWWKTDPKILGGDEAYPGQIPYQVAILRYKLFKCGGSIINECFILTASHCVVDDSKKALPADALDIVAGIVKFDEVGQRREIEKVIPHEQFHASVYGFDIALLQLKEPLEYNARVRPIPILRTRSPAEGEIGRISGWGLNADLVSRERILHYVKVPIANFNFCRDNYLPYNDLPENVFCAGLEGKDSCKGDSGGPLAIEGELAGIVSFGKGCGKKATPGIYTDVSAYTKWIESKMRQGHCSASYGQVPVNICPVMSVVVVFITILIISYLRK